MFHVAGVDVFVFGVRGKRLFVLGLSKAMKLQNEKWILQSCSGNQSACRDWFTKEGQRHYDDAALNVILGLGD